MKASRLQLSLGVSIVLHLAILGIMTVTMSAYRPPALLNKETTMTITLIAAPPEPSEKPAAVVASVVAPTTTTLPQPKAKEPAVIPIVVPPTNQIATVEAMPAPQTTGAGSPETKNHGDGSSPEPGLDNTTHAAQVGIRATPLYRNNPEPPYPVTARRRRQEGLVLLSVKVSTQGRAESVTLKETSGYPLLDAAALKAVQDWEFQPGTVGSIPVESEIEVPVRFKLVD